MMKRLVLTLLLLGLFVSAAAAQSTIFVVRHAEKAPSSDKDPNLSEAGSKRADSLAKLLKDANISTIYATEFKRTQQTGAPLAKALGIELTIVPAKDTATLSAKLRDLHGNALVVGHGNTIPDLIKTLGIADPISISENDYDNLFVVTLGQPPRMTRSHYP
jgi:2,3-bisphosphoglycerate-dependent phosphoglycerate mutase